MTDATFNHSNAVWPKDGKHLYFSANMRPDQEIEGRDSEIYAIAIATGELTKLTDRYGPDGNPRVSPDGKTIAYTGGDDNYKAISFLSFIL